MKCQQYKRTLLSIYQVLHRSNGNLNWWPGKTRLEICIGAVLTQNTSWGNVEKAIRNLKERRALSIRAILSMDKGRLAELIRPSGCFNQKADYLIELCKFLRKHSLSSLKRMTVTEARGLILDVKGIGEETADSILLYALGLPVFVIDAYTRRIFSRIGITGSKASYRDLQTFFHKNLPADVGLFNDYHAQIVVLGKEHCNKKPKCSSCPLRSSGLCGYSI